jgi:hypothetical protein
VEKKSSGRYIGFPEEGKKSYFVSDSGSYSSSSILNFYPCG